MPRLAWFSPLAPVRSGISEYNAELLPPLLDTYRIDVFVDGRPDGFETPDARASLFSAHDFIWKDQQQPYDAVVYQLGNAPCHDYMWAYLARYPGLVVLHDGQLHHARGRMLLQRRQPRREDYRREFRFNHPDADPDLAELGAVGLLGSLTHLYPMLRIVVETSRSVVVHNQWLADQILDAHPSAAVDVVEMGVAPHAPRTGARRLIRARHDIRENAAVFTAFGKATPEKRLREALRALATLVESVPNIRMLVAGETVEYYDLQAEAERLGIGHHVVFAGYLPDEETGDYLEASDVCLCMRWPTSRETSASWLRCLAAGKPTISTDLIHTVDIATLDPRNWSVLSGGAAAGRRDGSSEPQPVGASIDILDESHSLKLAIRRLATDDALRTMLGRNARSLWGERFRLETMVRGYHRVLEGLVHGTSPRRENVRELPLHLQSSGAEHAEALVKEILGPEYHLPDAD